MSMEERILKGVEKKLSVRKKKEGCIVSQRTVLINPFPRSSDNCELRASNTIYNVDGLLLSRVGNI